MVERTAFITGAARGIGAAVAHRLAKDGLRVVCVDTNLDGALAIARALPGQGHEGVKLDVTNEADVDAVFERLEATRPVSVLITCAGVHLTTTDLQRLDVTDTTVEQWNLTLRVNLLGTFLPCRALLRRRKTAPLPDSRIVTISSVAAQLGGTRSGAAYVASKSGVIGLTRAMAQEGAAFGVTANSVSPGLVDTPLLREGMAPGEEGVMVANVPLHRMAKPEEIAGAIAYLISSDAAYVTGSIIDVNGGRRMQ